MGLSVSFVAPKKTTGFMEEEKDQIVKNTKRVVKVKTEAKSKIDKSILKRMIQMMI